MNRSLLVALGLVSLSVVSGCAEEHQTPSTTDAGPLADAIVLHDAALPDAASNRCPDLLNPWDPTDPRNACAEEGASCSSSGPDVCSSALSCVCNSGVWNCAIAEADPVCWCGRQPSEGDVCSGGDGATCGECCPTPGGTGWPAMVCQSGHWHAAVCPFDCPTPLPIDCPADTRSLLGQACASAGQSCGDACCDTAVVCQGGLWQPGPVADCFACTSYACGAGLCPNDTICTRRCGPADGIEDVCIPNATCHDCSCLALTPDQTCTMIDGHPHVSGTGFCA